VEVQEEEEEEVWRGSPAMDEIELGRAWNGA